MSTETDTRHGKVMEIAMLLAEKNGYSVDAWRLFEFEADATLARMSERSPSIQPDQESFLLAARHTPLPEVGAVLVRTLARAG